jgi:hypothetical protein
VGSPVCKLHCLFGCCDLKVSRFQGSILLVIKELLKVNKSRLLSKTGKREAKCGRAVEQWKTNTSSKCRI